MSCNEEDVDILYDIFLRQNWVLVSTPRVLLKQSYRPNIDQNFKSNLSKRKYFMRPIRHQWDHFGPTMYWVDKTFRHMPSVMTCHILAFIIIIIINLLTSFEFKSHHYYLVSLFSCSHLDNMSDYSWRKATEPMKKIWGCYFSSVNGNKKKCVCSYAMSLGKRHNTIKTCPL